MMLKRPCSRCDEIFKRKSKYHRVCPKCVKSKSKKRWKRTSLINLERRGEFLKRKIAMKKFELYILQTQLKQWSKVNSQQDDSHAVKVTPADTNTRRLI